MKNANKRLLISIAALVIAIALAATTTFAWFTMDTTPEINDIDLNVTVQDGLYVSLTGADGDYYTNVDVPELVDDTLQLDAITFKNVADLTAENAIVKIADGTTTTSVESTDYYKRTIYLRSQSNYAIHLSKVTIDAVNDPTQNIVAWRNITAADLGLTGEEYDDAIFPDATDNQETPVPLVAGATLVATDILIPQGSDMYEDALITNAIRIGFAVDDEMIMVYNPAAAQGWDEFSTDYNGYNAAHDYFKTVTVMSPADRTLFDTNWANPSYSSADLIMINQTQIATYIPETDPVGNTPANMFLGTYVEAVGEVAAHYTGGLDSGANAWYGKEIDIYIWAEGTDADCFNEILKTSFTVSIELSGSYIATT